MELDVRFKGKINVVKKAPYIRMELADPQAKELPLVANGAFGFIGLQVLIICTLAVPRDALIIKFQNMLMEHGGLPSSRYAFVNQPCWIRKVFQRNVLQKYTVYHLSNAA